MYIGCQADIVDMVIADVYKSEYFFPGKSWLRPNPQQTTTSMEVEICELNKSNKDVPKLKVTISFQSGNTLVHFNYVCVFVSNHCRSII